MNKIINHKSRSKTFLAVSITAISLFIVSGFAGGSAFAQQRALIAATGTVVQVRLAQAQTPQQTRPTPMKAKSVERIPVPDLVEVEVQVANGEVYVAIAHRANQPRLGQSVMVVSAGDTLRIAE